jgi:hypothetical protein
MAYPTSPVAFPARSDGQTIFAAHLNALQTEVVALETSLVNPVNGGGLPYPQTIRGTRPQLTLDGTGVLAKGYVQQGLPTGMVLGCNVRYDGFSNLRDDTALGASQITLVDGLSRWGYAGAGANPAAMTEMFSAQTDGTLRERARPYGMGEWNDPGYNPALYTAATGTWTVPQANVVYRWALIGRTMYVLIAIGPSSLSAVTASVKVQLPAVPAINEEVPYICNVGSWVVAHAVISGNQVTFYPTAAATGTFPISANGFYLYAAFTYWV